ncbi:translation initiation factor eIF3 subunit [Perkinsus olseni]|uniref:Serine-threonine kinase receptor-associated protein n=2 Tax=Perkinsus olseni TaxID=32597 RepID=A0A7J6NID9_PEROL|nr:translation initiation factor eIF3 subunit [Perkinsus olseni]
MHPLVIYAHRRPVTQVGFNSDGDLLFTSGKDNGMCVWDAYTGERLGTYEPHKGAVFSFSCTYDSTRLVTGSGDQCIRVFDVVSGTCLAEEMVKGVVRSVEWCTNPNKQNRFVACRDQFVSTPNSVSIWDYDEDSNKLTVNMQITGDNLPGKALQARWGLYDETIITIHDEKSDNNAATSIFIWDAITGDKLQQIEHAHERPITKCQFSADRLLFVTASQDMTAKLWNIRTWQCVKTYSSDRPINDATINPLYRADDDDEEVVEDKRDDGVLVSRRRQHVMLGGGQQARDVTTTSAKQGKFESCLFHMIYENELGKVSGHFGPINTLSWSPDGYTFVSGGEDGYVRVHHMDDDYTNDTSAAKKWGDDL